MKYILVITMSILLGTGCLTKEPGNKKEIILGENIGIVSVSIKEIEKTSETSEEKLNELSTSTISMNYQTLEGQADLASEFNLAILHTSFGDITVRFFADESPKTVNNFLNLAQSGAYNGTKFHRVIKGFMIQGGDPLSKDGSKRTYWGTGGPDYRFEDEFNNKPLVQGSLAMANAGSNTNGSQFFIVTASETPWLDGKHTNFGEVISGMDVILAIEDVKTMQGDRPLDDVVLEKVDLSK